MKNFIVKWFFSGWLKEKLDKLPFNGNKRVLGIILLIVGASIEVIGRDTTYGQLLYILYNQISKTEGLIIITDPNVLALAIGAVTTVVGWYHAILKWIHKPKEIGSNKE